MCQLPRTQPRSVELTEQMINGFTAYPDTFPSADIEKLQNMLESFNQAKKEFNDCLSMYKQAGEKQKQAFEQLKSVIANQVKTAQVDTADSPVKLGLIGFGERKKKSAINLPAQPELLRVESLAAGVVKLQWQKLLKKDSGPVRSFIIESRIMNDKIGNWLLAGTSFDCETILKDQPKGVKLEYRVIAANHSGKSCPSNTLTVIL